MANKFALQFLIMPKIHNEGPYRAVPPELYDAFTLSDTIPVLDWFIDQSHSSSVATVWDSGLIEDYRARFLPQLIKASQHGQETYPGAAHLLVNAFERHNISNQRVGVLGSETPWIESILLGMNNTITTIEYNLPRCDNDEFEFCSYWDFDSDLDIPHFDTIISFSSTEHSGLGRYGDPLDPWGDIRAMAAIHKRLKPGGTLVWGGPVGPDALVWNAHRIYGPLRLPLLFHGFTEIGWYGPDKNSLFHLDTPRLNSAQPAVVLRSLLK